MKQEGFDRCNNFNPMGGFCQGSGSRPGLKLVQFRISGIDQMLGDQRGRKPTFFCQLDQVFSPIVAGITRLLRVM
jgi:hypothetical protein